MNTNKLPRPFRSSRHAKNWLAGMEVNACAVRLHKAQNTVKQAEQDAANIGRDVTPGAAYSLDCGNTAALRINGANRKLREVKASIGLL